MTLRLLHTADWQLGKLFRNLPGEVGGAAARRAVRGGARIAELAHRHEVGRRCWWPATCSTATWCPSARSSRRWPPCAASPGPGCCCPAITMRYWPKACGAGWAAGRPSQRVLATQPVPVDAGRRSSRRAAGTADRAAHLGGPDRLDGRRRDAVRGAAGRPGPRLGGRPTARGGGCGQPDRPASGRRARGSTIWHWATGTARSRSRRAPGMPERPSPTGSAPTMPATRCWWSWTGRAYRRRSRGCRRRAITGVCSDLDLTGAADPDRRLDRAVRRAGRSSARVVQLTLAGVVDLAARAALDAALARWAGEFCHLDVRDELVGRAQRARYRWTGRCARDRCSGGANSRAGCAAGDAERAGSGVAWRCACSIVEHRRPGAGA